MKDVKIVHHYHQKWLKKIDARIRAMVIGRHIFYREYKSQVLQRTVRHEIEHVKQVANYRFFGQWWIAIPLFYFVYICQWIKVGFKYRQIRYEIEARAAEKKK